jgi:hypothetical protein
VQVRWFLKLVFVYPEPIGSTELFDDYPGESLHTLLLTETAGQTTLTVVAE